MKLLTKYILKEHFIPFIFAFVTLTFLIAIEFVPKIVNQVIEKDLSVWIALELVALNLAWMLALSVPMAVLVATLMSFGRLTSDSEIIAIKSSGINILKIITPVLIAGFILALGMVQFNDKILPDLNKKAKELMSDVSHLRPTLVFRSGVFISDIPGFLVQIDKIDHSTSRVEGVSITEIKNPNEPQVIVAEYGFLKMTKRGGNMQFKLFNGEIHTMNMQKPESYRKVNFSEHLINISRKGTNFRRTESQRRGDREMDIDTMNFIISRYEKQIEPAQEKLYKHIKHTYDYMFADNFIYNQTDSLTDKEALIKIKESATHYKNYVANSKTQIDRAQKQVNKFKIEIYKKYSIPAASIAFVLIGAPLGIISRKGGMGVSIGISIGFFVFYWGFLIAGEDISDRGLLSPFLAMWAANFLVGGFGIYLLYIVNYEKEFFGFFRKK